MGIWIRSKSIIVGCFDDRFAMENAYLGSGWLMRSVEKLGDGSVIITFVIEVAKWA